MIIVNFQYVYKKEVALQLSLPAGEVHLVTTKVHVSVGEHGADLLE